MAKITKTASEEQDFGYAPATLFFGDHAKHTPTAALGLLVCSTRCTSAHKKIHIE
jgi:hypothetical protein